MDIVGKIKKWLKNINLKENNRPLIFLVCLTISTILWLVSSLGDTYETTVLIPVKYTNLPENKVMIEAPPSHLKATIKANGFTLVRHKFHISVNPIDFNINALTNNAIEKNSTSTFRMITAQYISRLSDQVSSGIEIIDISPDTLFFRFDELVEKEVCIIPNVDLTFENQYFLYDSISFIPEKATVRGPKSILDTLTTVTTSYKKFRKLNTGIKKNISLKPIENVEFDRKKVQMEIPVSQYTEYNDKVAISKFNVPDSVNLVTFPGKVNVSCLVPIHNYQNISNSSFIVSVDYGNTDSMAKLLPVKIVSTPPYVKNITVYPTEVEYFIEAKNDN